MSKKPPVVTDTKEPTQTEAQVVLETVAALGNKVGRLSMLCKAMAPAFIEYARGQPIARPQGGGSRPGYHIVHEVVGFACLTHLQFGVLLKQLVKSGLVNAEEFEADLQKEIETFVNSQQQLLELVITTDEIRPA